MTATPDLAKTRLYLLSGKDPFLQDEHLKRLRTEHAHEGASDTDYQEFHSESHAPGSVSDFLRTAPFLGAGRMAVYRGVEELDEESRQDLLTQLDGLPRNAVLVLVTASAKKDPLQTALAKKAKALSCQPPYEEKLPDWLCARAASLGARLARPVAEAVVSRAGRDLGALAGALERLRLYAHPRTVIEETDVEALLGSTAEEDVFRLAERIAFSDGPGALKILERLLQEGMRGAEVVGVLGAQAERLRRAAYAREAGMTRAEWAAGVKGHPYFLEKLWNQSSRIPAERWKEFFRELAAYDEACKTGRLDETTGLECLVLRACGKGGKSRAA